MIRSRVLVVDASVAVSILRKEAEAEDAALLIARWTSSGGRVQVPSQFWLETANTLLRRHNWPGAEVLEAVHILDDMQLETIELDRTHVVLAIDLAERHRLSAYDAGYLALTVSTDASIATFDGALQSAAGARAVRIGPARLSETSAPHERDITWPSYKGALTFLASLRAEAARPG